MALEKPRLVFAAEIRRGFAFNRFLRSVVLVLTAVGAYIALNEAEVRGLGSPLALDIGKLVAVVLGGLMSVRGLYQLVRAILYPSEAVRFYDKGFVWRKGRKQHKYAWHELLTFREGANGIYLFGRIPLLQWGAHTLTMTDGVKLKYTGRFGDVRPFPKAIRRYAAYVTGVQMGRALRNETPVKLHRQLTIYPTGVEAGKHEIHWSEVDLRRSGNSIVVRRKMPNGKFKTVKRYNPHRMDNVGGLLELATTTIQNYQPERFKKREKKAG